MYFQKIKKAKEQRRKPMDIKTITEYLQNETFYKFGYQRFKKYES